MNGETVAAFVLTGITIVSAIGSVLVVGYRVGTLVGTITAFMATSERDRQTLHSEQTRQADRLSLHIEHHGQVTT